MENTFFKLVSSFASNGPATAAIGLLFLALGIVCWMYWQSNKARLADVVSVIKALNESTGANEALERQFFETNRTRDALVAALSAATTEIKALTYEVKALALVMSNEGDKNRLRIESLEKSIAISLPSGRRGP